LVPSTTKDTKMTMYMAFRRLSEQEKLEFRNAARENYALFSPIDGLWHPVYQHECVRMNAESATYVDDAKDES
jgi:hypothetical protein